MQPDEQEYRRLYELMLENQRLLTENHSLLKKMRRASIISFWFRVFWTLFIIGVPFILYFYVIEPYFDAFGSSIEEFREGLQEVPGWKQFYNAVGGGEGDEGGGGE
jgi:hypothetical protein